MKLKKYIPLVLLGVFLLSLLSLYFYMKQSIDFSRDELLFKNANQSSVISIYTDSSANCASDVSTYVPELRQEVVYGEIENRWIALADVPEQMIDAILCTEDRNFYNHNGVNIPRTIKALINHITKKHARFGASTLTQQVIKNISGDNEFSVRRKVDEIFRAYSLENNHTKDEILEMYLNIIPMGDNIIGICSGSNHYFDKEPMELTLAECATLVAVTNAPSRYHPIRHPENAIQKRNIVLSSMLECGKITDEEYQKAISEPLLTSENQQNEKKESSWFSEMVIKQVKEDLIKQGMSEQAALLLLSHGGLKIYSTEEHEATRSLEEVFYQEETQRKIEQDNMSFAMFIVNNETGNISAVLGNERPKDANRLLNLATDTPHTPGSSLKPIAIYAPLIDKGKINVASVFDDVPQEFIKDNDSYRAYPQNLPRRYDGLTTVCDAIKYSKNTIAMRLYHMLGSEEIYSHLANELSFCHLVRKKNMYDGTLLTDLAPSPLALGQLTYGATLKEMTDAYTAFARDGVYRTSRGYIAVYDKDDNLILENKTQDKRIYKRESARIMNQLLMGVVSGGTAKTITLKQYIDTAGKTGTSGDDKDRLFIGYTPYYTAGIWCAKKDNTTKIGNTSLSHLTLWDKVMINLHSEKGYLNSQSSFSTGGLVRCKYCLDSGAIPSEYCKMDLRGERIAEGYFSLDNMPKESCKRHVLVKYDTLCNALACPDCYEDECVVDVALLQMPERHFPVEVVITDAEYMTMDVDDDVPIPNTYQLPYFYYAIEEGDFVGRSREKKQKNSSCYYHKK